MNQDLLSDAQKWQIAAELSATLPAIYDRLFRSAVGNSFDRLEMSVWLVVAERAVEVASMFNLKRATAAEIAETLMTIVTIFFGPRIRYEHLTSRKDLAVILIRDCSLLECAEEVCASPAQCSARCLAFMIPAVQRLNPAFTLRFVRARCLGDRGCEVKVIPVSTVGEV
ncbi:hypothetical protein [Methanosphaerula palustris]|uniref:Metanogen output domain-containing protein n=1 Tax=Methanosphaerula palustris (strain ATCC BAA-1556 / DSM 19958 / E1-9c) TaxID=521011 RepID=B8GKU0_METPE|nr:hypothetical protein [Methanosphaerula palustris]ACL17236.1 conserved hypothetical protein [Methanosphaerula palustris E1-9c]